MCAKCRLSGYFSGAIADRPGGLGLPVRPELREWNPGVAAGIAHFAESTTPAGITHGDERLYARAELPERHPVAGAHALADFGQSATRAADADRDRGVHARAELPQRHAPATAHCHGDHAEPAPAATNADADLTQPAAASANADADADLAQPATAAANPDAVHTRA